MPKLLLKFETAVIKEIPVEKKAITVGRKSDNDIVLDNQAVSGYHCRISSSGNTFFVEDLASTNGTRVNGKKIIKAGLHHNDVVEIIKYSLVFINERQEAAPLQGPQKVEPVQNHRAVPAEKQGKSAPNLMTGAKAAVGKLQVTEGVVKKVEYELTELSTYIGKSDRVAIPIKGAGMFGAAPEVAAMIARRPEGYYIVAIKEGYPALNGAPITKKEPLKDGDVITVGATTFRFSSKIE